MPRTLIMIHGRDFKPARAVLRSLWVEALRAGLQRDHPASLRRFDGTSIEFVYYGDISNAFLERVRGKAAPDDGPGRRITLELLKTYSKQAFFDRKTYRALPGRSGMMEAAADALAPLLGAVGLSDPLIEAVAPDMREYWNEDTEFGSAVREPMIVPLKRALRRGGSVCIIAHSLGSLIAWDTFWKFCHTSEYRDEFGTQRKIDLFITLGSPLSDNGVRRRLKGASASGPRRYPCNLRRWVNVVAEDDYIAHDENVANDFKEMIKLKIIDSIEDIGIYNLSLRNGRSNPHHEGGYLIHPALADLLAKWMRG